MVKYILIFLIIISTSAVVFAGDPESDKSTATVGVTDVTNVTNLKSRVLYYDFSRKVYVFVDKADISLIRSKEKEALPKNVLTFEVGEGFCGHDYCFSDKGEAFSLSKYKKEDYKLFFSMIGIDESQVDYLGRIISFNKLSAEQVYTLLLLNTQSSIFEDLYFYGSPIDKNTTK
jgi:hypothetical protein